MSEAQTAARLLRKPTLPLPEPLRAAEEPSFTHYSVVTRLPEIARRTLAENPFPPEIAARIQALIDEIPHGKIRPIVLPDSDGSGTSKRGHSNNESADWSAWTAPYLGQDWLQAPWFFIEEYFYIRILEATGYFGRGDWERRDPYTDQKRLGLVSERARLRALAANVQNTLAFDPSEWQDGLTRLLLADLWGNQSDLSLWPVKHGETSHHAAAHEAHSRTGGAALEHVLSNDLDALMDYLEGIVPAETRIDILLDNAGYELAADLALADYLLESGRAAQVRLHAKTHPVFVSDALEKDIFATLDYLVFEGHLAAHAMAVRLRSRLVDGRLRIQHHPFWTSPLAMWDMPGDLVQELRDSSLLISKGDANYRRLLGDLHWPNETPFSAVMDYLPFALLALRTLKSEITLGIPPERVPADDAQWMTNGRWGLIQFAPPSGRDPAVTI